MKPEIVLIIDEDIEIEDLEEGMKFYITDVDKISGEIELALERKTDTPELD